MVVCGRCDCKNGLYMRKIDDIIIHCTATAEGRDVSVADIRRWHKARGFVDVGYHYVVYLHPEARLARGRHAALHLKHGGHERDAVVQHILLPHVAVKTFPA